MGLFSGILDGLNQIANGGEPGELSDYEKDSDVIGSVIGGFFGGLLNSIGSNNDDND